MNWLGAFLVVATFGAGILNLFVYGVGSEFHFVVGAIDVVLALIAVAVWMIVTVAERQLQR